MLAFGAAPVKPRSWPEPIRPGLASLGLAMKNSIAFLLGFAATSTPILIYIAWVTWRIAEAI